MQNVINNIQNLLEGIYPDDEISAFTRLIFSHVTGKSLNFLLSDKSTKITDKQREKIEKIVERLQKNEPIQYILGETEFYGLPFAVNSNVLIPRPETEELVDLIIGENKNTSKRILDIGTGSGCIAISLKKKLPQADVYAWDISPKALETAAINATLNTVEVAFEKVDILADYSGNRSFDIIVSNPPYVLDSEKMQMEKNVLEHEPHTALFVPDNTPLLFYERIAEFAKQTLVDGGKLYFEINRAKGSETVEMLREKGFEEVELIKDISSNDRIVKATFYK